MPLGQQRHRTFACPHLPHDIEAIRHREMSQRGKVVLAGKSEVLSVALDSEIEIAMLEQAEVR